MNYEDRAHVHELQQKDFCLLTLDIFKKSTLVSAADVLYQSHWVIF